MTAASAAIHPTSPAYGRTASEDTPSRLAGDPLVTVMLADAEIRRMREGIERLQEESGGVSDVDGLVVGMALGALVHEPIVGGAAGLAGAHWLRKRK
jgi:hypothetical protein